jgi:hypothetical protein
MKFDVNARKAVRALLQKEKKLQAGEAVLGKIGLYDAAEATSDFEQYKNKSAVEYLEHYWDAVHFQPYIYNELNKLLLNQICPG